MENVLQEHARLASTDDKLKFIDELDETMQNKLIAHWGAQQANADQVARQLRQATLRKLSAGSSGST